MALSTKCSPMPIKSRSDSLAVACSRLRRSPLDVVLWHSRFATVPQHNIPPSRGSAARTPAGRGWVNALGIRYPLRKWLAGRRYNSRWRF